MDNVVPVHRFSIAIRPSRLSTLGVNSAFDVVVTANVNTPIAQLDVVFPEVERSKLPTTLSPVGQTLATAVSNHAFMGANTVHPLSASVVFPGPGLYRIAVSARDTRDTVETSNGVPITSLDCAEGWIYTDESGSRYSDSLTPTLVPDSVIPTPGPRLFKKPTGIITPRAPSLRSTHAPGPSVSIAFELGDCDQFHVIYYNGNSQTYQIAPGLSVTGVITEDQTGNPVGSINTGTDQYGDFYVCTGPGLGYSGQVQLLSSDLQFETTLTVAGFGGGESNGYYQELIANQSGDTWYFLSLGDLTPESKPA